MCSIQEAWGDISADMSAPPSASQASANLVRQGQQGMDDQVGQYYTQSDDRRQYAKPVAELSEYRDWHSEFNRKPAPEANGIARGMHGKYDRTPRAQHAQHANNGAFSGLETDVNPAYFARSDPTYQSGLQTPAYLDAYPKPKYDIPNVGPLGMSAGRNGGKGPEAANSTVEAFMSLGQEYFKDQGASPEMIVPGVNSNSNNKFTPEQITNKGLLATAPTVPASNVKFADNQLSPQVTDRERQIQAILARLAELEKKLSTVDTNKSHDIILFIVIGIFVLFVLDNIFKLGRFL
jgi:hypothetical protein